MKKVIACVLFLTMLFSLSTLFVNASDDNTVEELSSQLLYNRSGKVSFSNVDYMKESNDHQIGFNTVSVYNPTGTNEAKLVFTLMTTNTDGGMVSQTLSTTLVDNSNPMDVEEWDEMIASEYYVYHPSTIYEELSYTASNTGYTSRHSVYPQEGSIQSEYSYTLGLYRSDDNILVYTIIEVTNEHR